MLNGANFRIMSDNPEEPLVIVDMGPWDKFKTITNDVENVVDALAKSGRLGEKFDRRLFYFDSDGDYCEILIADGRFFDFRPDSRNR